MPQQAAEERPIIDKVYEQLQKEKQPKNFYDLIDKVLDNELTGDERDEYVARLYTNMNMDGRFLCVGENFWGLKGWYPVEQRDEEVAAKMTPKRKRKKDEDDLDDFEEIDDGLLDGLEDEDYDDLDEEEEYDEDDLDYEEEAYDDSDDDEEDLGDDLDVVDEERED
ncbi:DNA-directed RNA polymerase subunit delta [Camelliibacillus cellulosilyticus]|uniref:Probable DNA-directed RNA polymerase subunit delta n=1 Tax=Camelliibacillus cellulosilyticus TaxID=2174486 RepID=A0ABV9GT43_9BACL